MVEFTLRLFCASKLVTATETAPSEAAQLLWWRCGKLQNPYQGSLGSRWRLLCRVVFLTTIQSDGAKVKLPVQRLRGNPEHRAREWGCLWAGYVKASGDHSGSHLYTSSYC